MAESVIQRVKLSSATETRNVQLVLSAMQVDLAALTASLNQLITDYNANATIATDTTATAVTLTTTA